MDGVLTLHMRISVGLCVKHEAAQIAPKPRNNADANSRGLLCTNAIDTMPPHRNEQRRGCSDDAATEGG